MHIEQVSKNIGEHGRLQSLVETFTGQAARWWDTHQTRLKTWTTGSTYFVERFGQKKLTKQAQIPIFTQGQTQKIILGHVKKNGENLATMMNEHGHTYSHQPSLT